MIGRFGAPLQCFLKWPRLPLVPHRVVGRRALPFSTAGHAVSEASDEEGKNFGNKECPVWRASLVVCMYSKGIRRAVSVTLVLVHPFDFFFSWLEVSQAAVFHPLSLFFCGSVVCCRLRPIAHRFVRRRSGSPHTRPGPPFFSSPLAPSALGGLARFGPATLGPGHNFRFVFPDRPPLGPLLSSVTAVQPARPCLPAPPPGLCEQQIRACWVPCRL